jgi:hypothetical protein
MRIFGWVSPGEAARERRKARDEGWKQADEKAERHSQFMLNAGAGRCLRCRRYQDAYPSTDARSDFYGYCTLNPVWENISKPAEYYCSHFVEK